MGAEAKPAEEEAKPAEDDKPAVAVSAATGKELRGLTGAGMMDCKKALKETGGDVAAAEIFLKKKGMASADKKAGRTAAEGLVSSYIHAGSRIGVLLELNSETDFVARNPEFKELVDNFAMQIAASPNVEYVSVDDADQEFLQGARDRDGQGGPPGQAGEHPGADCGGPHGQAREGEGPARAAVHHRHREDGRRGAEGDGGQARGEHAGAPLRALQPGRGHREEDDELRRRGRRADGQVRLRGPLPAEEENIFR